MATRYRITYNTGTILVNTQRGTIEISHRQAHPDDDNRYVPVLDASQRDRMEALGARNRIDYYVLPLDQAEAVFALAVEAWGEPTSNNGNYPIPTPQAPATETEVADPATGTALTDDATRAAARLIYEHGDTLYSALRDHIARQAREATPLTSGVVAEDNEDLQELADHILDIKEALTAPDLWTLASVAEYVGASTASSARRTLGRWGVKPTSRATGRGGQNLYDPADIKAAKAARPGRGKRNDLADA